MLSFHSASVRSVNSERAIAECLDVAFEGAIPQDCRCVIINATLGHRLGKLSAAVKKQLPDTIVVGSSCSGVIGREGVGESMNEVAIMAICGPKEECAVASVREIYGSNAYEKGLELANSLYAQVPKASSLYLLCPGIDIANDLVLKAFSEVYGESLTIFGGISSDNMRGLINHQCHDEIESEHDAWAIGFADPTLHSITRATHGFSTYGNPLVVTKASGNRIIEFDGKPAWPEYLERLALPKEATGGDSIPIGALGEMLPAALAEEYGNTHILRVITKYDDDGTMYYPVTCQEGLQLWLTVRDEELIFSEQRRALEYMRQQIAGKTSIAVFQTDCLARGRYLFNKVVKDEIIAMIQGALASQQGTPPWLGMYGFGEYAKLGGKNTYHNYSTALLALYR